VESLGNLAWWSFNDLLYLFRFLKSFFYTIFGLNKKILERLKKKKLFFKALDESVNSTV